MTLAPVGSARSAVLVLLAVAASACAGASAGNQGEKAGLSAPPPVSEAPVAPAGPTTTTLPAPPPRTVSDTAFAPFATVEGVTLVFPALRVERVGFHQSNHEGARQLEALPTTATLTTLESRERSTGDRTAADIVADPGGEIRAPVTGRVLRSGTYVLYCEHSDDYAVIEPDGHPGWEVKILHIHGVQVRAGDRVIAGESPLALHPTQLPFESQVDELRTADPAWPHVHVEVVDPSIPNVTSPGGGC